MTKAQALALVNALEARSMPCDTLLRFDAQGVETWAVELPADHTYTGAELEALASYCRTQGLALTAQLAALGIT